ncbi:MAG TPA: NHL repeat-containing protein [Solirubrobacterales bacterium]|nr:NHL repeat-containing protein [Solirubrobacterales bacterium]
MPKYFTDYAKYGVRPTTYIDRVTLKELQYRFSSANPSRQYSPYFYGGIFDVTTDNFVALASRTGVEGQLTDPAYHYQFHNPNQNGNAKGFGIYLASNEFDSTPPERHLWASFATITLADPDKPKFDVLGMPSQWMNDEPLGTIPFSASDQGLGVSKISLANPRSVNVPLVTSIKQGCVGGAEKPCPKSWSSSASGSPQLSYDPSVMPQGENWIVVNAHDPAGRTSADGGPAPQIRVKVDHTAPTVKFSGTLADQSTSPPRPDYTLKYAASDGFDATPSGLTPILPSGTGEAKPQRPLGIAADGKGNIWMVDRENGRIVKYNEAGSYLGQFGTYGSGPGQFLDPRGIAVAPDGTIWVADAARGRIQQFNAKGEYLRGFGAKSSVPTNDPWGFVEAWGVAVAPDGKIWVSDPGAGRVAIFDPSAEPTGPPNFVADAVGTPSDPTKKAELVGPLALAPDASGNVWVVEHGAHRVDAFNSAGKFLMRFGSEGVGDGQFKGPVGIALAPTGHLLVTDAGNHRVQVFLPSGAYLRQFASYGQDGENLNEPRGIALGAGNTAFIADAGSRRIARWDGVDVDPQSGVVSTEIKVDGNAVEPKHAPGCSTKNCSISREWTVGANDYNSGQHKVEVTAIDGVGLSNTRSLTLTTDDTPPQITSSGKFFTSPGGWLEQKGYFYSVYATDAGGFGVTSLVFKIDGSVVWSQSQECVQGGCSAGGLRWTDMTPYDGGAHAAEVIATDIAGNVRKKTWTINVSPKGEIPVSETVDTLEALEETSAANAIGEAKEEGEVIGSAAGLGLEEEEGEIVSAGSQVPLTVAESPDGGLTLEVVENPDAQIDDPAAEELPEVLPVTIEPVQTSDQASQSTVIGGNATVAADTGSHVDTVVRPLADGGMTFQNIRDALGPESFSWEVQLYPEQQLKWIDDTHAGVFVDDHLIFSINATAAHDAVGTNVSTKLTVSGSNIITLTVQHRATSFVYPVIAGTGWQGGFVTSTVEMPPPESPPEEEGQGGMETFAVVSAPEPAGTGDPNDATASKISTYVKRYGFYACETLPEGCPVWKHKIKGFFFYNGRHAWWKDRHPVCEHSEAPNVSISVHYCDWIGPNHQPYGNGYHITSQTRFEVTKTLKAIDFSKSHALTVRMYGSGGWYGGGHARVCNPSRPECA